MNKNNRRIVAVVVGIFLIAGLYFFAANVRKTGGPKAPVDIDSGYRLVMGTIARIVAVAADSTTAKKAIEAALRQLYSIEDLCSIYKPDSEISRINRSAAKEPVRVSRPTFEVLQKAIEFSEISEGAFDITVGVLSELWHLASEANSVPADVELTEARCKVGYEKLILDADNMTVRFAVDGMKLDAGGIAKGYAIDKAVEAMQNAGAVGGMVDVGGDIRVFGAPPQGKSEWLIGLQDPAETETVVNIGRYLLVLNLTDSAVATSGDYRRFALIDNKKYSHIIDTKTGYGSSKLASVTVIAPNAADADAIATAVSVMGQQKGLALIESIPHTEAILITLPPQYKIIKTTAAEKYIK
jgi:thiamine biosynthesis lipoprotein